LPARPRRPALGDVETLAVLDYLADALVDERVLCLCTARPAGAAAETLARLRRQDPRAVIGLHALPRDDIDRVVTACLATGSPPPAVLSLVETHSEGNPFLIEELLAGLAASGALTFRDDRWTATGPLTPTVPFDFGQTVRRRLSTLDDTTRRVVTAAALLGRRFDWELLPGIAEVDGRAVVDGLRQAVHEQLVEVEGSAFTFRHALTREAVLAELLPPERRDLARRAWPAVVRAHPGLPGPWCELAADLAEACDEPVAAARHLVECAGRAVASGALASAEATAVRARALAAGDPVVLTDAEELLVQALALAGKPEDAAAVGDPLVERLVAASAPPLDHVRARRSRRVRLDEPVAGRRTPSGDRLRRARLPGVAERHRRSTPAPPGRRAARASATTSCTPLREPGAISRWGGRSPITIEQPDPRGVSCTTCMCSFRVSWSSSKPTLSR
jgi:hypothetical protein